MLYYENDINNIDCTIIKLGGGYLYNKDGGGFVD